MTVGTTQRKFGKLLINLQKNSQKLLLYLKSGKINKNLTKKHGIADALKLHFSKVAARLVKNRYATRTCICEKLDSRFHHLL
jgi:hypothetical protein